mmetsp:Transcript_14734/g.31573  ORF Transcript_14734/g.31573 Transcript_14734/m.31573 type:complete len:91 (-) Transcript_14734:260-532(-)
MSGGIAPTTAPTSVLIGCIALRGVYIPAYNTTFVTPRNAHAWPPVVSSSAVPAIPHSKANAPAALSETRPVGSGRTRVRVIFASDVTSYI